MKQLRFAQVRSVAEAHHLAEPDTHPFSRVRKVDRHASALRQKADGSALAGKIRPRQQRQGASGAVDAEAVGAHHADALCGHFLNLSFQSLSFRGSQFAEAGGENLRAGGALFPAGFQRLGNEPGRHGDDGKVDVLRNILNPFVNAQPGDFAAFGIDREYFPFKPHGENGFQDTGPEADAVFSRGNPQNRQLLRMEYPFIIRGWIILFADLSVTRSVKHC